MAAIFAAFLLNAINASAQQPAKTIEPSFDVILQTVVASNDAGSKSDVAPSLSDVVRKLKTNFPFSTYRLGSTDFQKISNRGSFESRGVTYLTEKNLAVILQYAIRNLEVVADEKGDTIQIGSFEFYQRMPIFDTNNVISYEQLGIKTKFNLAKNMPTVIGTLPTSKPAEVMFLVLTVKPAEK